MEGREGLKNYFIVVLSPKDRDNERERWTAYFKTNNLFDLNMYLKRRVTPLIKAQNYHDYDFRAIIASIVNEIEDKELHDAMVRFVQMN